ncbi:MAG: transposase [Methanophagales archaeon]|nr:transposase [Methanophagales archaeon]
MSERQLETVKSVWFGIKEKNREKVRKLLEDFRDMINFCIGKALELNITSYYKLRKAIYEDFKERFDYATHYCHSACRIATSILKNWRRRCRRGEASWEKPPEAKRLFARLEKCLFRLDRQGKLEITLKEGEYLTLDLIVHEYQQKFLASDKDYGELILKENGVFIPFKDKVKIKETKGLLIFDTNETNLTGLLVTENEVKTIFYDLRKVYHIHRTYEEKQRRIQKLKKQKPLTAAKIQSKYSKRRKRRVRQLLHVLASHVAQIAKEKEVRVVFGDLSGIREKGNKKRRKWRRKEREKMNRRLNSWNFHLLQFLCEYKVLDQGHQTIYVSEAYTSRTCPVCGCMREPNGALFVCERCGFKADRHVVAAINIAKKFGYTYKQLQMWGLPLAPNAFYEVTPFGVIEKEGLRYKCY